MTELCELGVAELLASYATGEASPVEAVEACLNRIEVVDKQVGAVETLNADQALFAARESERRWREGEARSLEGVPFGLKDTYPTAGVRATAGSSIYEDFVPGWDCAVAARLKAAGGVMTAMLKTFEMGWGVTQDTKNPWDLARTAGGSSSGSAAALAARELPLTIGGDSGGSIRGPASYVGVCGLKPTFGRISRRGDFPASWTLSHPGPMARTAEDIALALGVIAGYDPDDPYTEDVEVPSYVESLNDDLQGLRLGVAQDWFCDLIHPGVTATMTACIDTLESVGVSTSHVTFPLLRETDIRALSMAIWLTEFAANHQAESHKLRECSEQVQQAFVRGHGISAVDYVEALRARYLLQQEFEDVFGSVDAVILPSALSVAPRYDDYELDLGTGRCAPRDVNWRTKVLFNIVGVPCISIPSGFIDGLPVGVQIVGRPFDEGTVLRIAHTFQRLTDHHAVRPAMLSQDYKG